ncbi:CapA family protein, partial [Candidatus Omnitrophota bacterium]
DKGVAVLNKCSLRGNPKWGTVLQNVGFRVVSLANNHMMDFGEEGLKQTLKVLKESNVVAVGAGMNAKEALSPQVIDIKGKKVGIMARSSVEVTSHCYAEDDKAGAAYFDEEETNNTINRLKKEVDFVILIMHWGLEEYHSPTPKQRIQAHTLIDSGADTIVGSHAHVFQGFETVHCRPVLYSLANFLADDFSWEADYDGKGTKEHYAVLSEKHRNGVMVSISLTSTDVQIRDYIYTTVNKSGTIDIKTSKRNDVLRYSWGLKFPCYSAFWKLYSIKQELFLRIFKKSLWKKIIFKLHRLRIKHFIDLFAQIKRSLRITSGKSTNPYD